MMFTDRDQEVVETLNRHVRMLTLIQIAAAWWSGAPAALKNASKRLRGLTDAGLIHRQRILARPLLPLSVPEASWKPGQRRPEFGELSWRLASRWADQPRLTTVYCATARSLGLFGGSTAGRIKNLCQVTHDLHLATVYLIYRSRWPAHAANWRGEDGLAERHTHKKTPDALLINDGGHPYRVVEFGGSYSAQRLAAIHRHWSQVGVPYEIW